MSANGESTPSAPEGAGPALPEDALAIIAVRNMVLFPGFVAPVAIGRADSIAAAQHALRHDRLVGILLQTDPASENPTTAQLHATGTAARVVRYVTAPDGSHHVVFRGETRFRVIEFLEGFPFPAARVEQIDEAEDESPETEARMVKLKERAAELLGFIEGASPDLGGTIQSFTSASALADFIASLVDMKLEDKQLLLATLDVRERMDRLLVFLGQRIEVMRLTHKIEQETKGRIDEQQREFLLREQLKTIQQELGETEDESVAVEELGAALEAAKMPEEVAKHARKELKRLARMHEGAAEYSMLRTYLEWLSELPWALSTEDRLDIGDARRILDEDHCGLDKIKQRILEHLAVHKLNPAGRSPILCFVGPPGVGKTSLGQSIARATGRKFARVSLGGVHDEAEIRGHRRTYIGALPGNIVEALRKAGSRNCVMMLDEIDKLGAGIQGDPSAALLEVLDPEQNVSFRDNYLAVPFDLSAVMFIATANVLDSIPPPLRDRMELIQLPGYTEEEKALIARRYLVGRQLAASGLDEARCSISDEAIAAIIRDYTREAGVRNLEREIGKVFRHVAMRVAEGEQGSIAITPAELPAILGSARFENEVAMRASLPGVATGLAWTPAGGDILFIEASITSGNGRLILTGQLGDVMKESAQAALTLAKGRAERFGLAADLLEKRDIHVHVPAGAIPKDGPSAGVAMFIALASLLTNRPVHADLAMTGEISLRGLVLPVGGIKEKVLAAQRAGIGTVLLPARNRKDIEDIPAATVARLRLIWLETVDDALEAALEPGKVAHSEAAAS
ncbi:MAG: endopeptidase La [Zoogloeaceae bacterium]|nr:endopeptidase La [Zoogloeaceae bacterium]MCW5616923.1 endopeptidase La [Rhodocyclaceae bacterium]